MRSIRSAPPMVSFHMEIFKSDKLLFPLLQNIPFSPWKLGMRQKSSKCSISCVRSAVLLQWCRFTWKSSNLTNFFSHSYNTHAQRGDSRCVMSGEKIRSNLIHDQGASLTKYTAGLAYQALHRGSRLDSNLCLQILGCFASY